MIYIGMKSSGIARGEAEAAARAVGEGGRVNIDGTSFGSLGTLQREFYREAAVKASSGTRC